MQKPRSLLIAHRWIALVFAPLLLLQAATGAILLFRDELTQFALPAETGKDGKIVPLSTLAGAAIKAFPDLHLKRIFFPVEGKSAAFAQLEGTDGTMRYAAIDPDSGIVLASGSIWRFPHEAALQVHYKLMSGPVGLAIVALNGLALAVLALSGVWHWWPGASRVARELGAPARAPARLKLRMWHRSVGAVLAFVLLSSAVTGMLLSVPDIPAPWAAAVTTPEPSDPDAKSIDRAFGLAQSAFPASEPRDVRFAADGSLSVNFLAPRGGKWAVDVVTVSTIDERVTSILPFEQNHALWITALPIHTGDTIGPAGRWPILAAAFALVFLAISGPLAWWRSRRKGRGS
ncbi:MAG: PepSY domain-containing protein [Novosphingobium sp.]|nr:PepSY domain-containing protein [Novosphingobium sp.]